jgi:hypothetical protein
VYAVRYVFVAVEKGMPAAVVATIEWGRPFIDANVARRGGKKAREEARGGEKKERERDVACERRRHVEVSQRRRDDSPAPSSPLRQNCDASFMCG